LKITKFLLLKIKSAGTGAYTYLSQKTYILLNEASNENLELLGYIQIVASQMPITEAWKADTD
jgi:hypothetical protein